MRRFRVTGIHGFVAAKAGGVYAIGINAEADKLVANGAGATHTERAIVFVGAAFVAMAFHEYCDRGIPFKIVRNGCDFGFVFGLDDSAVVIEVDGVGA